MDNRKFTRKNITLSVRLTYPAGETQVVHTRDISDGGLFLILDKLKRPIIGELVTVELMDAPENSESLPSSEAVVVRQEASGIGLSFIVMDFAMDDD